jgi:RNA polymerase sigma factor (sigma-70 family)
MFTYDDIFQIGCIGLSKAAMNYRPGKNKFSTYAYITIRNEIFDALDYATFRERHENTADTGELAFQHSVCTDFTDAVIDLDALLDKARTQACNMVVKGIDAIRMMVDGYTAREIGEMMGGVPAKNVTAWVSKARKHLRKDPAILSMR